MNEHAEHVRQLRALLENQRFAVLSTLRPDGHPYANLVAFWASPDLSQLVFCTLRATRKFSNLEGDERVALVVDNRSNEETDLQEAAAVTVLGSCRQLHGVEREQVAGTFLARHPGMTEFVRPPSCAVMQVEVRACILVTRFQNVVELHVEEGWSDGVDTPSD